MAEKKVTPNSAPEAKKTAAVKTTATPATAAKPTTAKPATAAKPTVTAKTSAGAKTAAKVKTGDSVLPSVSVTPAPKPKEAPSKKEVKAIVSGSYSAAKKPLNIKAILISCVCFVLVLAIIIGSIVGSKSCSSDVDPGISDGGSEVGGNTGDNTGNNPGGNGDNTGDDPAEQPDFSGAIPVYPKNEVEYTTPVSGYSTLINASDTDDSPADTYSYEYSNATAVGYYGLVTSEEYQRVKPVEETTDESSAFDSPATGNIFANGAKRYPSYGSTLKSVIGSGEAQVAARSALVSETAYLCAWGTRGANRGGAQTPDKYTKIDKDGYLYQYKDGEWIHSLEWGKTEDEYSPENYRQLYKHSASVGMYREGSTQNGVTYGVFDDAKRVVKEVTMRPRGYSSYGVTGLYAPAGEVIKIELSGKDMNATGGLTIHIGQALYNGQANNIWVGKNQMQRPPLILTTLALNKTTCEYDEATDTWTGYVGSFLGGPLYIRNPSAQFTAKISGGLEYLHFILGYTTPEEFNRIKQTSRVPYFDLEVWSYGVLHSGPRNYAEAFSYENLYNAAILWEKVSSVTTRGSNQGIVFLYDAFVAAGAAVAFPGRSSVNCPLGWMSQSLNYNTLVSSGSWGNFHEYHHNFQNYGLGSGADGETTNNGLNLVSYALFTKISSKRGIGTYGAAGLGGWNNYTSASWTLQRVLAGQIKSTNGLAVYATLLHNFGAEAFINARGAKGANNYFNKWATVTHNDFTYYAKLTNDYYNGGSNAYTPSAAVKNANYPMFVPVASVYQVGRSYMYDGQKTYFKTMQPYIIANAPFNIDLSAYNAPGGQYASGSIVIPEGFTYKVKKVTKPPRGTIEIIDEYNLKYTPASGAKTGSTSGQIIVTLEITKDDGAFNVDDVDLVLDFEISQEVNKMKIDRTTYTYTADTMYSDAVAAYDAGFAGSTNGGLKQEQFNPTQNANTDIWFYPDTPENRTKYPNAPDKYFFHDNNIEVIDGKLYFDEDGTYRVYLRGRDNCALYYSADGKNYSLGARITASTPVEIGSNKKANSALFRSAPETYFDVMFEEGDVYIKKGSDTDFPSTPVYKIAPNESGEINNWLHIKEVLIVDSVARSFIGVGMRQWDDPQFTQQIKYYRDAACTDQVSTADFNSMTEEEQDALYTQTYYLNNAGQVISEAEVLAARATPPTVTEKTQPYINAYRNEYDFPNNSGFKSDYFYFRSFNYNYTGTPVETVTWDEGVKILDTNFVADTSGDYGINNLLEEGTTIGHYIHSKSGNGVNKGAIYISLDMGKTIDATSITFLGRSDKAATTAQQGLPKQFVLEISTDGVNYENAGTFTNGTGGARMATVNLGKTLTFRYVKITVNSSHSNNSHLILSGIRFTYTLTLTGNGSNHISPDTDAVKFIGDWKAEQGYSSFGRIYRGTNGSKVNFEFTGTRLAVLTPTFYDSSFEVWIDGVKVDSIEVKPVTDNFGITYISQPLSNGKHKVEIRCTGDAYIDSLALYQETA